MVSNQTFIKQLDTQTSNYSPDIREIVIGTVMKTILQCSHMPREQLDELSGRLALTTVQTLSDSIDEIFDNLKQEFNLN